MGSAARDVTKIRVLVLDDDAVARMAVADALEAAGFEVTLLENPFDLPATVDHVRPDLVLIDDNMPSLSGSAVIQQSKRRCRHECGMLLYSAALSKQELEDRASSCEAAGYVLKTGDPVALADAVWGYVQTMT